jgi:hypothetical protein
VVVGVVTGGSDGAGVVPGVTVGTAVVLGGIDSAIGGATAGESTTTGDGAASGEEITGDAITGASTTAGEDVAPGTTGGDVDVDDEMLGCIDPNFARLGVSETSFFDTVGSSVSTALVGLTVGCGDSLLIG